MGLRKVRIRRLVILTALILLAAWGLWLLQSHKPEGDEGTLLPPPKADAGETDRTREVLTLGLGAVNCARVNAGLNEVKIDKALTEEAIKRLGALRSPRRGNEYEAMVQGSEIKSVYRIVFLSALETNALDSEIKDSACSLPWFSVSEGDELAPLQDPNVKKVGLAGALSPWVSGPGAPDGNRVWIMITWR